MATAAHTLTPEEASAHPAPEAIVVRFAGDSGDGMQLTGGQFTLSTALAGNDLATFPDFPAEIRAPQGTLFGVSAFQINFGSAQIDTAGDQPDVLVAMNPAALKTNVDALKPGGLIIADEGEFGQRNLDKAKYAANPLEDGSLAKWQLLKLNISQLTLDAVKPFGLGNKEALRCKNMWTLGLALWMFDRDRQPLVDWLKAKFAKAPELAEANIAALNAGHAYGETAELGAMGIGEIYTFGPTFRAENSNTPRHLAEFWMIEPEMAFYEIEDNMDLAEEFIKYCVRWALDHCADDLRFLNDMFDKELIARLEGILQAPFVRLAYGEGIRILEEAVAGGTRFEFPIYWGADLAAEHERFLVEQHFKRPVILTDYPKEIKAFYMKQNDDGRTVRAMDVLFPKIGEIIGGSEREADFDRLQTRIEELHIPMKDMWWYLDTRRFGACPHSGFGLGFERLLLFVTGMANIRDVIPFPRTPKNAEF